MKAKHLPIGYWIKQADQLLTKGIDDLHSSFSITRIEWQILNSIGENEGIETQDLIKLMLPFADASSVGDILIRLKARHLINDDNLKITLTDPGIKLHSACMEKQKIFRQSIMINISEQDYQTTVLTLEKMVENITRNEV